MNPTNEPMIDPKTELQNHLSVLQQRRKELADLHAVSKREMEAASQALAADTGSIEEVSAARSRWYGIGEALAHQDGSIAAATSALDRILAREEERLRVEAAATAALEFAKLQGQLVAQWEKLTAMIQSHHVAMLETAQHLKESARQAHDTLQGLDVSHVEQIAPMLGQKDYQGRNVLQVIDAEGERAGVMRLVRVTLQQPDNARPVEQEAYKALLQYLEQQSTAR
jgi:hypothetical protein